MKKIVFLLCIIILSCSTFQTNINKNLFTYTTVSLNVLNIRNIPVYIDKNFNNEDQTNIIKALKQWNYVLNNNIIFIVVATDFDMGITDINNAIKNRGLMIIDISSKNIIIAPQDNSPNESVLAWTDESKQTINVIRSRMSSNDVFEVMLHELGHALGAVHVQKNSLMYPVYTAEMYKCIDKDTVEQISQYNNLKNSELNYCYTKVK